MDVIHVLGRCFGLGKECNAHPRWSAPQRAVCARVLHALKGTSILQQIDNPDNWIGKERTFSALDNAAKRSKVLHDLSMWRPVKLKSYIRPSVVLDDSETQEESPPLPLFPRTLP